MRRAQLLRMTRGPRIGPLAISGVAPVALTGAAYSFTPTLSGGRGPYTVALTAGALPADFTLAPATGQIASAEVTSVADIAGLTLTVTDADGRTASLGPFNIQVSPELGDLGLSTTSFPVDASAGQILATITGRLSGDTISTLDDRFAISGDGSKLLRGLGAWAAGASTVALDAEHPSATNSPHRTTINITIEAGSPVLYDHTVTNDGDASTPGSLAYVLANHVAGAEAELHILIQDGVYTEPNFIGLMQTHPVHFYGGPGVVLLKATLANFDKLDFYGVTFATDHFEQDTNRAALRWGGYFGDLKLRNCRGRSGYNGDYVAGLDPTDLSDESVTDAVTTYYVDNRYPELAAILPNGFDANGGIAGVTITRKNIGTNTPTGEANGVFDLTFQTGFGGSGAAGTFTVVAGVITSATITTPGTGYGSPNSTSGVRPLGTIISWANRKTLGGCLASGFVYQDPGGVGSAVYMGPLLVEDCEFHGLSSGIKFGGLLMGKTIRRNTFDVIYIDAYYSDRPAGKDSGPEAYYLNRVTRPISCPGDPGDPHSDAGQWTYLNTGSGIWRVDIFGNVTWPGNARGVCQIYLLQDIPSPSASNAFTAGPYGMGVSYNLGRTQAPKGISIQAALDLPVVGNDIARWDTASGSNPQLTVSNVFGTCLVDRNIHLGGDGQETRVRVGAGLANRKLFSSAYYAAAYTDHTGPRSTIEQLIAAYTPKAAYPGVGPLHAGSPVDLVNLTFDDTACEVFIDFTPVFGVTPATVETPNLQTSGLEMIWGGPAAGTFECAAGVEARICADKTGAAVISDWAGSGVYERGQAMELRVEPSMLHAKTIRAAVTFNGTVTRHFQVTTASLTAYPGVANAGAARAILTGWTNKTFNRALFAWEVERVGAQLSSARAWGGYSGATFAGAGSSHNFLFNGSANLGYSTAYAPGSARRLFVMAIDLTAGEEFQAAKMVRDVGVYIPKTSGNFNAAFTSYSIDGLFGTSAGIFSRGNGDASTLLNGVIGLWWAHFWATDDASAMPDILDPAVADQFLPDNIGADGSGPFGGLKQPDFCFYGPAGAADGTEAETWNAAAGLSNRGAQSGAKLTRVGAPAFTAA